MKAFSISIWLILGMVGGALAGSTVAAKKDGFKLVKTAELAQLIESTPPGKLYIYDANGEDTRKSEGVIKGAKLLSSHDEYDLAELPTDPAAKKNAKLVFYCGDFRCTASHTAAEHAIKAGFKDVAVLSDGIKGWKKNGQPVVKP